MMREPVVMDASKRLYNRVYIMGFVVVALFNNMWLSEDGLTINTAKFVYVIDVSRHKVIMRVNG